MGHLWLEFRPDPFSGFRDQVSPHVHHERTTLRLELLLFSPASSFDFPLCPYRSYLTGFCYFLANSSAVASLIVRRSTEPRCPIADSHHRDARRNPDTRTCGSPCPRRSFHIALRTEPLHLQCDTVDARRFYRCTFVISNLILYCGNKGTARPLSRPARLAPCRGPTQTAAPTTSTRCTVPSSYDAGFSRSHHGPLWELWNSYLCWRLLRRRGGRLSGGHRRRLLCGRLHWGCRLRHGLGHGLVGSRLACGRDALLWQFRWRRRL